MPPPKSPSMLQCLTSPHSFHAPKKCINEGADVTFFLSSYAYTDLVTFLLQLTASMFPRSNADNTSIHVYELGTNFVTFSPTVIALRAMLDELNDVLDRHPPDTGPRRFGNAAFRGWYIEVEERLETILEKYLPDDALRFGGDGKQKMGVNECAMVELKAYLLGSWGSAQRLDYGTGHELSFLAFLGCLWKLGAFGLSSGSGSEERGIVLGIIDPYLTLIRRLIKTYTLEPAGSHGVWGLDDHSFLPYIFGSAQLGPPLPPSTSASTSSSQYRNAPIPTEGSLPSAPPPASIAKASIVEKERGKNMYFGAVGFINDVKKGPFWEHSPMLFDISGVEAGWAKICKGMIKMYIAEVLSKFPVVQHFPFGSLFRWERDPDATPPATTSAHVASHTTTTNKTSSTSKPTTNAASSRAQPLPQWSSPLSDPRQPPQSSVLPSPGTQAPWSTQTPASRSTAIASTNTTTMPNRTGSMLPPIKGRAPPSRTSTSTPTYAPLRHTTRASATAGDMATKSMPNGVNSGNATGDTDAEGFGEANAIGTRAPWAK